MSAESPHPSADVLARYTARRLPAADVLAISDHLAGCAACREALARVRGEDERGEFDLAAVPPLEPLSYEEMTAWLDGTLDETDQEIVAAKLEASPRAAAELADLEAFRRESDALPPRKYTPGSVVDSGEAQIVTPPSSTWRRPATWLTAAAAMLLALAVGRWFLPGKQRDGDLALAHLDTGGVPDDLRREVVTAVQTGRLPVAALPPELRGQNNPLAGDAAPAVFAPLDPVATVVRTTQPVLRWSSRAGADGYVAIVQSRTSSTQTASPLLPAGETSWTTTPLARDEIYEWQVEAWRGDTVIGRAPQPPAPEARFLVLGAEQDAALSRLERTPLMSPLVLGVAYTRAGLYDDARAQFRLLAQKHPDSALAPRLLHRLQEIASAQSPAPTTTHGAQ